MYRKAKKKKQFPSYRDKFRKKKDELKNVDFQVDFLHQLMKKKEVFVIDKLICKV